MTYGSVQIYDSKTLSLYATFKVTRGLIHQIEVLKNQRILGRSIVRNMGIFGGVVVIWNLTTKLSDLRIDVPGGFLTALTVFDSSDELIVTGSKDGSIRIWNSEDGKLEKTLLGHTDHVTKIVILYSSSKIVSGSKDDTLRVWNPETGLCERTLEGHESSIIRILILPDNRIISVSKDRTFRVWNITNGNCEFISPKSFGPIDILKNGEIIQVEAGTFKIWDSQTWIPRFIQKRNESRIKIIEVLPNNFVISGSNDGVIRIWE